jgi:hypothetical protein
MNPTLDFPTIYNSINPNALAPRAKKPMPFPLENFDEEISDAYAKVDRILTKLSAAANNPVNQTPAKKRRLKSLKYKTKTCLTLLQEISTSCSELWY